jgi:hypothetical protein
MLKTYDSAELRSLFLNYVQMSADCQAGNLKHLRPDLNLKVPTPNHALLHHGRFFEYSPLPDDIAEGPLGDCFKNAGELSQLQPDRFLYVEGYATGVLPMPEPHGWCIDRKLRVVDPTWTAEYPYREYFGIAFRRDFADTFRWRSKLWCILLNEQYNTLDVIQSIDSAVADLDAWKLLAPR